jgi:hypothetical protein
MRVAPNSHPLNPPDDQVEQTVNMALGGLVLLIAAVAHGSAGRSYCLRLPDDFRLIHPPALRPSFMQAAVPLPVQPPVPEEPKPVTLPEPKPEPEPQPTVPPVPVPVPEPLRALRRVKAFARACGGADKALEVLKPLPDELPLAEVLEYLSLLADN